MARLGWAVVVPTLDRRELLEATLDSIAGLDTAPDEVVVVSDGCTDGTDEEVRRRGIRLLRTSGREGAAAARNLGWRATSTELIAFVDDDCQVGPAWLDRLSDPFADDSVGLVQGRTRPAGTVGPWDRTIEVTSEYGLYESCNIAYRRTALEDVGGFDEAFGRHLRARKGSAGAGGGSAFGEDTDLAWRVRRAGWETAFAPDAEVAHHVFAGTARSGLREEWRKVNFPWLLREIPELRTLLPGGPWYLRRQSPWAQLFLCGIVAGASGRIRLSAVLAAPYLYWVTRSSAGPRAAARQAARDVVASAALVSGSVRHRNVLL